MPLRRHVSRERRPGDRGRGLGLAHADAVALTVAVYRRLLREALPKLPKRQKEALLLKLQNDWKYERIAQEMGTSVGSVKAHIFHAIQNLTRHVSAARQGGRS